MFQLVKWRRVHDVCTRRARKSSNSWGEQRRPDASVSAPRVGTTSFDRRKLAKPIFAEDSVRVMNDYSGQILEQAIGTTSTQKTVHRGLPTRADAKSWSIGISTAPPTRGQEVALRAPTPIRGDQTQRGKCCVFFSVIRFLSSQRRAAFRQLITR